jgi:hypothetical protein
VRQRQDLFKAKASTMKPKDLFDFDAGKPPDPADARLKPTGGKSLKRADGQYACLICGERANFGFGVNIQGRANERWACPAHEEQVKNSTFK